MGMKRHIARLVQRMPWLAAIMVALFRQTRPRFTCGTVGVVLNGKGEVLLVEHVFHPKYPWGLPGGWMDRNEAPDQTLRRECREELGMNVTVLEPLVIRVGIYQPGHLDIAYLCQAESDVMNLSDELMDYRWVSFDALPTLMPFHQEAVAAAKARWLNKDAVRC